MTEQRYTPGLPVDLADEWREGLGEAAATLPESGIIRTVNYGRGRQGLIPMWVGEGDLPTAKFICDAATKALYEGRTHYTYQRGVPRLRRSVADFLERSLGCVVSDERVIISGSGMQGMMMNLQATAGAGDEVIVVSPVWPNIFACIHMQQAVPVHVPLSARGGEWHLDLDRLFDACGARTRAIYVNSPNNPTGWVMSEADMTALRDFARARGLWIIADEVYTRFVYDDPRAHSFLELTEPEDRLLVCNTFSKNWAMTGWRVGWVVIPPALGQVYENLVQYNVSGVPEFLQHGCIAAVEQGDELLETLVERCRVGRGIVCDALETVSSVRFTRPRGAFYLFFAVDGERDSVALARRMVDEANVGLAPGSAFGEGGEGFLRMCFATSHDTLSEGVERLCRALAPGRSAGKRVASR